MSTKEPTSRIIDLLLTALAPLVWGSTYIITSEILPPDRPFTASLLRTVPAGLLLLLCCREWPKQAELWRLLTLSGLNITAFQALLFISAYRLPGGLAAVIGALQPLLILGLAWRVDSQRPPLLSVATCLLGMAGMAALLLAPGARFDGLGVLAAFGGALCMGLGTFLTQRWGSSMSVLGLTAWQLLLGGLMLLPAAALLDPAMPSLSEKQWLAYIYLCLFGTLLAYLLWFRGVARLSPVTVSSLGLLSPLAAVLLGWSLLGQALSGQALLGMVIVLGSILIQQISQARTTSA